MDSIPSHPQTQKMSLNFGGARCLEPSNAYLQYPFLCSAGAGSSRGVDCAISEIFPMMFCVLAKFSAFLAPQFNGSLEKVRTTLAYINGCRGFHCATLWGQGKYITESCWVWLSATVPRSASLAEAALMHRTMKFPAACFRLGRVRAAYPEAFIFANKY
jgi:hypothetical protein